MTMTRLEALALAARFITKCLTQSICPPAHHSTDDKLALKHSTRLEGNHSFSQNHIESAMQSLCPTVCTRHVWRVNSPAQIQSPSVQSTALYTRSSLHVLATADGSQVTMHAPLQLCLLGCLLGCLLACLLAEVCRQCLVHFQQN